MAIGWPSPWEWYSGVAETLWSPSSVSAVDLIDKARKPLCVGFTGSFLDKDLLQRVLAWVDPQSDVVVFR